MAEFQQYCLNRRAGTTTVSGPLQKLTTLPPAASTTDITTTATTATATVAAPDSDTDDFILAAVTKFEREGM